MDDRDRDAFERFARRFAGIEAEVKDPPPFARGRGAMSRMRHRPRALLATAAGVVVLVVMVAVLGPRLADRLASGPVASGPGTAASAGAPAATRSVVPSVAPTVTPTPDPFAGLGPAVFCGSVRAVWCDGAIALVREAHPDEVATAAAILVDDTCPEPSLCFRYGFSSAVILIPRSGIVADAIPYRVWGNDDPESVTGLDFSIPDHMLPLVRAVAAAPTVTVGEWRALCVDVDEETCAGVAALALNNLAWSQASGMGAITERRSCPAAPDWADTSRCWQARTPVNAGETTVCAVIAKRPTLGGYGQIAGDQPGKANGGTKERGCPADFMP